MSKFKIGVVGAGMGAKPHGQALADLADRVEVAGVYTRNPATRDAFAAAHGFQAVNRLETLTDDPSVDAVLVLTPPNARLDIIRACVAAGKHVLSEKPLERTVDAAQDLVDMCDTAGVRLGVMFQHRYRQASRELAQLLSAGTLGAVHAVRVEVPWWRDQAYYDEPGRGTYARDGGGVLISQAIHTLDLMMSLVGPVSDVQAMATTTGFHQMESEDFVAGAMRFENGAIGSLMATVAAYPGDAESITLDCARASVRLQSGVLHIHWHDRPAETRGETATTGGGADPMAFPFDWHRDVIWGFAEAVRAGRDPVPSGRDALLVQRLIAALMTSSTQGAKVAL